MMKSGSASLQSFLLIAMMVYLVSGVQIAKTPDQGTTINISSNSVSCQVDLDPKKYLSLNFEKVRPNSPCKMTMNSAEKTNITVTSKADLVFQGCITEDVRVTASGVVDCANLNYCLKTEVNLSLPELPPCLPAPLSSVTWTLRPDKNGAVALFSPNGPLKQVLPDQPCNDSLVIKVDEEGGPTVGDFCHDGTMKKVLIHSNVSVTVRSSTEGGALRTNYQSVLAASFQESLSEKYIFEVSPSKGAPVLLATPGWPKGMMPFSTVSWIVSVPQKMEAHLTFPRTNQPRCQELHTSIVVQTVGSVEELYSRREDAKPDENIVVSGDFYLNMTSCKPETGDFSVMTKVTLKKCMSLYLIVIIAVVAVLLILIVVLVVVCLMVRKKKQQLNADVSVYNSGNTNGHPNTWGDDQSHVYNSIEDSLVYSHLLRKREVFGVFEDTDTYHSFTRETDFRQPLVPSDGGGGASAAPRASQRDRPLPDRPPSHTVDDQ